MKSKIIKSLAMGSFVGSFIILLLMSIISLRYGPQNISFDGTTVINAFLGTNIVGWAFSLSSLIYEKEEYPLPLQVIFQMFFGLTVLYIVAIYLQWMPINLGIEPIISWIVISLIFAAVFWLGFYAYYKLLAREINKKLNLNNLK